MFRQNFMFAIEEILGLVQNVHSHSQEPLFWKNRSKKLNLEHDTVFDREIDHEGLWRFYI